jgi:NDP-sugar pyrophosphorylase family protein
MDAIILCGGTSWRLKPDIWIPKPKLKINGETLISHQVKWLKKHGINRIILATNSTDLVTDPSVEYSLEEEKLGTGGVVRKAVDKVKDKKVYVMNVDDIIFYDPKKLCKYAVKGAATLMAKPKLLFGRILTSNTYVTRFEQKPLLDFYVNVGHYVFVKSVIEKLFPEKGDLELQTLQFLADKRMLRAYAYKGLWLTINTAKDLYKAREYFKHRKNYES